MPRKPKPTNWRMYGKMALVSLVVMIGGPALIMYVSPTEEQLFLKYNPELQKRSLENRVRNQEEFDAFVGKLKEYSRDKKRPIWEVAADEEKKARERRVVEQEELVREVKRRKEEMRREQEELAKEVKGMKGR